LEYYGTESLGGAIQYAIAFQKKAVKKKVSRCKEYCEGAKAARLRLGRRGAKVLYEKKYRFRAKPLD